MKKEKLTLENLQAQAIRAARCDKAEIPGSYLREIIRLAIVGWHTENQTSKPVTQ